MRIDMALVVGALVALGSCDPPEPDWPYCRFGPYTLGLMEARAKPESVEARSLARVESLPPASPSWAPPPPGRMEQELWQAPYGTQRLRMSSALFQALSFPPGRLQWVGRWQGEKEALDVNAFQWQGLRLLPAPLPAGEIRRQVEELRGLALQGEALEFASKGPELQLAAWPLVGSLGLQRVPSLKAFTYTLTLIELVDEAAREPEDQLKRHFQVPRPYASETWGREMDSQLPQPRSSSFPAGHASHATAVAVLLAALGGADAAALQREADRVAERRRLGRLHTRADNEAGAQLGRMIAAVVLAEASLTDGPLRALCRRVRDELAARHAQRP